MSLTNLLLQSQPPTSAFEMVVGGTLPTKIVLTVLALGSFFSWWLIFKKSRQFRKVRQQGDQFLDLSSLLLDIPDKMGERTLTFILGPTQSLITSTPLE